MSEQLRASVLPSLQQELQNLDPDLLSIVEKERNAEAHLIELLPTKYTPEEVGQPPGARAWELAGLYLLHSGRVHEARGIFWKLYEQMLEAQGGSKRVHKGMPLVWISECFWWLGFPVHAKRYLMLTLCEDALLYEGKVPPNTTGVYFRLVWRQGLPNDVLQRYARQLYDLAQERPGEALFPEALLQQLDNDWLTELPSAREASSYMVNTRYVNYLLSRLGRGGGQSLELLAEYLMSCIPGCRTRRRGQSVSTDYDIVCSMEGYDVDFRSELGRYFVCECKLSSQLYCHGQVLSRSRLD